MSEKSREDSDTILQCWNPLWTSAGKL